MGVDLTVTDHQGNSPLWVALRSRQESIASNLVSTDQPCAHAGLPCEEVGTRLGTDTTHAPSTHGRKWLYPVVGPQSDKERLPETMSLCKQFES